jgi:hypothetical protein
MSFTLMLKTKHVRKGSLVAHLIGGLVTAARMMLEGRLGAKVGLMHRGQSLTEPSGGSTAREKRKFEERIK